MPLYTPDPNDSKKQIPNIQGSNRKDRLVNPNIISHSKTPSYVVVNTLMTTPCAFFFGTEDEHTAAHTTPSAMNSASNYTIMGDDLPAGTRLDIHPTAWSGSAADIGKITFVYKSGLSTGGR